MNTSESSEKKYFIGIDLGTSSVKLLLADEVGVVLSTVTESYDTIYSRPGWSEQSPEEWLEKTLVGFKKLLASANKERVKGIGITGQMNGLVMLDENDRVIRPAILWNDGRTEKETIYLNEVLGKEVLLHETANIAFASFTAPKIMWIRDNEPEKYCRIRRIMVPKDYLVYRLTGRHVTDVSDASGTLLFDVKNKCWSDRLCQVSGARPEWLPEVHESSEAIGKLRPEYEEKLGVYDVTVAAGAGDNEAAAVSTGTIIDGDCNISLGTSGTAFIATDSFVYDKNMILHCHRHANGKCHLLGCVLSAASCCNWWVEHILKTDDYEVENRGILSKLGRNNLFFLPYLMGDRMLNDVNARASFIGMSAGTSREDMFQAVMEGVGFGLRDCLEAAKALSINVNSATVCGGGAKNRTWLVMLANILNIEIKIPEVEHGPSLGAAILAMAACGVYPNIEEAVKKMVKISERIEPDETTAALYDLQYEKYKLLYPALKDIFPLL